MEDESRRVKVASVFSSMHTSVVVASAKMLVELKRYNYVTPTNFLELVKVRSRRNMYTSPGLLAPPQKRGSVERAFACCGGGALCVSGWNSALEQAMIIASWPCGNSAKIGICGRRQGYVHDVISPEVATLCLTPTLSVTGRGTKLSWLSGGERFPSSATSSETDSPS